MELFDVYPLFDIEVVEGKANYVYDSKGDQYLDLYGGHAVVSIGHRHPHYVKRLAAQLDKLTFYSNAVQNPLQKALASHLGRVSNYDDYTLFLINSGAEANENALKLASFHTGRKKVLAFGQAFHGRTSAAVAVTDNPNIVSPINQTLEVTFLPYNDTQQLSSLLSTEEYCAVIVEPIQGVGGVQIATEEFLTTLRNITQQTGTVLIADEIQSGYGRSGRFFAHQYTDIRPDIITVAKGMGNGFPIGGVLINPHFKATYGLLGTTFGGNHLACVAALAVLEVMEEEKLIAHAQKVGNYLLDQLLTLPHIKEVRGRGLMIGIECPYEVRELRKRLLYTHRIFTGISGKNIIRLLPPLTLTIDQADHFLTALRKELNGM